MKLTCISSGLTDRTLERFWQSVNDATNCINNGNSIGSHRIQEGNASFEGNYSVDEDSSIAELQKICSQINVASDEIIKTAPITPTQGEQFFSTTVS